MPAPKGHAPYPGCETGGRPRRYTIQDIENYAEELISWSKIPTNIWFKDFCLERDIDPDFMAEWALESEKFNGAYKLAYLRQESNIFKGSMFNNYNMTMSKMALTNWHNWSDKQETKLSGDKENPVFPWYQEAQGQTKDLVNNDSAYPQPIDKPPMAAEQPILYSEQAGEEG